MDPAPSPSSNSFWHRRSPNYGQGSERSFGFGRVWAAIGILILACLDIRSSGLLLNHAMISAAAFAVYSLLVLLLFKKHRKWPERTRFALHCLDVVCVVVVALLVHSSEAALFLLCLFVLLAAAQRGPSHVLWTGGALAVLLAGGLLIGVYLNLGVSLRQAIQPGPGYISLAGFVLFTTGLLWQISKTDVAQRWESSARAAQRVRAHVSRDLHDSAIQSLFSVDYRLEKLKSSPGLSRELSDELAYVQRLVQRSEAELRQVVNEGRPVDLGRKSFVEYVTDLAAEFERETGIAVRFVFDGGKISPPPAVASELVRIVQEALVNVRKHSGARNVAVGFTESHGRWNLRIDDDGRGFEFAGRLCMMELEEKSQGPFVIRERVSSLGGELEVESIPGHGARLEIAFPKDALG
jgi:signal transduction histidine kinase